MHDYSIDGHPKEKIVYGLSFSAIFIAPKLNDLIVVSPLYKWLVVVGIKFGLVLTVTVPVFGLFCFFYWLFENRLWKFKPLRKFMLVPDLNGEWECNGELILKEGTKYTPHKWNGNIRITQSWSKILIYLKTTDSESESQAASIRTIKGRGYKLIYYYQNDPKKNPLGLNNHSGTAELVFDTDCTTATGTYFTDENRNSVGNINLRRKS